ncbi:MAG: MFS transporter [Acetobacteraceae bacterium]|nr:MFS transporter [Acetobacteraceae bacterium]
MFGYRRGATLNVLVLLSAMSFLLYVDRVNLSTAAGPIMKELGLSNIQLGLAFSAFGYSYLIFQLVGGYISDRFGSRAVLLVCGISWVLTTIGTALVDGFWALVAIRFVLGMGEGATLPAAARALTNWTPQGKRGFAQGVTHSCSRFGNAVTPPIVTFLVLTFSWRASFVVLGVITAVWVLVWFRYFRDDPRRHPAITEEEIAVLPDYRQVSAKGESIPWGPVIRRMAPTMIVYFCYGWTGWLFFTWLPTFFLHGYGLDLKNTALFSSAVFFSGVVGDSVGGMVSDWIFERTGNVEAARRNVLIASLLGAFVFLLPVLFTGNLAVVAICLSAAFFMLELTIGPIWAVPMDVAPRYAGTASGLMNAGSAVAGIISPIAFGFIIDRTGNWTLPFVGSACLLLVGAAATLWVKPQRKVADAAIPPGAVPAE